MAHRFNGWAWRPLRRDTVVPPIKTITALLASYAVAVLLIRSQAPVYAPFAALFAVQPTLYRSLLHAFRYLGAVVIGIAATGAVGMALGETFWTLTLLVIVTVVIGEWRWLSEYGKQAAVVGLFAFAAGGGDQETYLTDLLLTVLCGAQVGLAVNVLFAPPLRTLEATGAVRDASRAVSDLLREISESLRGDDHLAAASRWREDAAHASHLVDRARQEIEFGEESSRLNPRRLLGSSLPFVSLRSRAEALTAVSGQLQSICRVLFYASRYGDEELAGGPLSRFLPPYAELIEELADATGALGEADPAARHADVSVPADPVAQADAAGRADVRAREGLVPAGAPAGSTTAEDGKINRSVALGLQRHRELAQLLAEEQATDSRALADCGALLVEAERMLAELEAHSSYW